ncbi:hypothetical protein DPMN_050077 [Dreissena polymorpha]|uniref:Uncharacterized protein n=1 Tax=Dreissena polymorpha TaxID=45954 RepID=A0A9D4CG27_DREPO|nr:hypothetical protein DPMN_050077 [Dreissena polymorpha]
MLLVTWKFKHQILNPASLSVSGIDTQEGEGDMQGRKRGFPGAPGKPHKKLKGQPMPKNALMHLYELKPGENSHIDPNPFLDNS